MDHVSRYPLSTVTEGWPIRAAAQAAFERDPPHAAAVRALAVCGGRFAVVACQGVPVPFLRVCWADDGVVLYALAAG